MTQFLICHPNLQHFTDSTFKSAWIGFVMGLALGGIVGFRAPKKLAKDEFIRQLKYCLDGIGECIKKTQEQADEPLSSYEKIVTDKYFGGCSENFNTFRALKGVTYSVETLKATFISPTLENYLGHHSFIKIEHDLISTEATDGEMVNVALLEFTNERSDMTRQKSQSENPPRNVSGEKLVEMLCFHEQLQLTHACTTKYLLTKMKQGEVDCLSYVNKILTGTNQAAAKIKRFDGTENFIGRHFVGFFIEKLNPFTQDALDEQAQTKTDPLLRQ